MTSNSEILSRFCDEMGGRLVVKSILISNNGLAAVKFIRSIRLWSHEAFGNDRFFIFSLFFLILIDFLLSDNKCRLAPGQNDSYDCHGNSR